MTKEHDHLTELPEYRELMRRRARLIWPLLVLTIGAYMAFILAIAFFPGALGRSVGGSVVSWGIVLGIGLIFFNFLITLYYVRRANREIEPLLARLREAALEGAR